MRDHNSNSIKEKSTYVSIEFIGRKCFLFATFLNGHQSHKLLEAGSP